MVCKQHPRILENVGRQSRASTRCNIEAFVIRSNSEKPRERVFAGLGSPIGNEMLLYEYRQPARSQFMGEHADLFTLQYVAGRDNIKLTMRCVHPGAEVVDVVCRPG